MWICTAAVPMTTTELYDLNWPINTENQQIIKSINSGQNLLAGRQTVLSDRSYVMRVSFKFHWFGACPRVPDANTILRRTTGQHGALTIHSQTIHRVFAITYSYSSIHFVLFLKQKNFKQVQLLLKSVPDGFNATPVLMSQINMFLSNPALANRSLSAACDKHLT